MPEFIYSIPIGTTAAQALITHNDGLVCVTHLASKVVELYFWTVINCIGCSLSAGQSPYPLSHLDWVLLQLISGSLIMCCSFGNSWSYFVRLREFHRYLLRIQLGLWCITYLISAIIRKPLEKMNGYCHPFLPKAVATAWPIFIFCSNICPSWSQIAFRETTSQ